MISDLQEILSNSKRDKMKKGDLVNFYSTFSSWQEEYTSRNPGIILASREPKAGSSKNSYDRGSAYILWANGEMTKEHLTYLKVIE